MANRRLLPRQGSKVAHNKVGAAVVAAKVADRARHRLHRPHLLRARRLQPPDNLQPLVAEAAVAAIEVVVGRRLDRLRAIPMAR